MTQEETIRAGAAVKRFMDDDAVQAALAKLDGRYVAGWKAARTPEEREAMHAKVAVLNDFLEELRVIVSDGELEAHKAKVAERRSTPNRK